MTLDMLHSDTKVAYVQVFSCFKNIYRLANGYDNILVLMDQLKHNANWTLNFKFKSYNLLIW